MKKTKICVYCNREFETQNNKKQYCSDSCRVSACRNGLNGSFQENLSNENLYSDKIQELEAKNEVLRNENLKIKTELNFLKAGLTEKEHQFKNQNQKLKLTKLHFDKKLYRLENILHQIEINTTKDTWDKIIPFVPVIATALSALITNSKMEQNNQDVKKALEAIQNVITKNAENNLLK